MKIDSIKAYIFSVPVDFKISKTHIKYSHQFLVTLECGGIHGIGSGVLYKHRPDSAYRAWKNELLPYIQSESCDSPASLRKKLSERYSSDHPSLVFALDTALWDIEARSKETQINKLLHITRDNPLPHVEVTEQIFISDWNETKEQLAQTLSRRTNSLKVKLGDNIESSVNTIARIRKYAPKIQLKLDANQAYSLSQAIEVGKRIKQYDIKCWEEPLRSAHGKLNPNYTKLKKAVDIPVVLDESIMSTNDLRRAIGSELIDIVNIKLSRVGGITKAIEYIQIAHENDIDISIGCSEDLGAGMASIVHLASAVPGLYGMEGVGSMRLGTDYVSDGLNIQAGNISAPKSVKLDTSKLGSIKLWDLEKPGIYFGPSSMFKKYNQKAYNFLAKF